MNNILEKWAVKCRIISEWGSREFVVKIFYDRDMAEKWAEILNEGSYTNPKANAIYYIQPLL